MKRPRRCIDGALEKMLGPEHPDTLTSISHLNSVLVILARQRKCQEAE
jgi:hypothetical protein